jgi:acetone carboxylase alpha subunit
MTTEDCYDNYDLYLNYLRGGPGFGDPIDREVAAIEKDLNGQCLLPEYAEKVYGAACSQDAKGVWHVDAAATEARRAEMRKERVARSKPVKEWMKEERERILRKDASTPVQHMYATSFGLSGKFLDEFRSFWTLPPEWVIDENELGVPSYGSKFRMDLSKMPDVTVVTLVEE